MEWSSYERLMELRNSGQIEEAIRESETLAAAETNPNDKASVLTGEHVCLCILRRFQEARHVLQRIQELEITDLDTRLNAEFCEPCLLMDEGQMEEGIAAFEKMLARYSSAFKEAQFRYLYEDIQSRRAWALFCVERKREAFPILKEARFFCLEQPVARQQMHFALGVCSEEAGDGQTAKEEYLRAAGLGLKDEIEMEARFRLARLQIRIFAFAQAIKQLETILDDYPADSPAVTRKKVYLTMSIAYSGLGDEAGARRYKELAK